MACEVCGTAEPASVAALWTFKLLQRTLDTTGIGAELMTLRDHDIDDSPHLPTGRSYLMRVL
jgi:hypothetical protein